MLTERNILVHCSARKMAYFKCLKGTFLLFSYYFIFFSNLDHSVLLPNVCECSIIPWLLSAVLQPGFFPEMGSISYVAR